MIIVVWKITKSQLHTLMTNHKKSLHHQIPRCTWAIAHPYYCCSSPRKWETLTNFLYSDTFQSFGFRQYILCFEHLQLTASWVPGCGDRSTQLTTLYDGCVIWKLQTDAQFDKGFWRLFNCSKTRGEVWLQQKWMNNLSPWGEPERAADSVLICHGTQQNLSLRIYHKC